MELKDISKELFAKIRGRFPNVQIGNGNAQVTNDPDQARFFDFDYKLGGKSLGRISITVNEKDGIVVIHPSEISKTEDKYAQNNWFNFLKELRQFAKSRLLNFDTRDITKNNLEKRDYEFLGNRTSTNTMSESFKGTSKTSYQNVGNSKLIIKHFEPIDTEENISRLHKIESIFVETRDGERFKYPYKHINGARAMARHISENGKPYDDFGKYIIGLSEELSKLKKFKNYMNRSAVMAETLKEYAESINSRIEEIKDEILHLQKESFYKLSKDKFTKAEDVDVPEDIKNNWIDELTIKSFNEELKDVFPYIYKIVTAKKIKEETPDTIGNINIVDDNTLAQVTDVESLDPIKELEDHLDSIIEDKENALFSSDKEEQSQALEKLNQLMSKHFPAGVNGINGLESIAGIIDDENLNDQIREIGKQDSSACLRPLIYTYIQSKRPDMLNKLKLGDMKMPKEGNQFAQAVRKAKAAGMKSGDKFKVGDKEYTLKDAMDMAGLSDGDIDFEVYGDDGNTAPGKLYFTVQPNGKVDPKSLQMVLDHEYHPNHKLDNKEATEQVQPGGEEHAEALRAAQESHDEDQNRLKMKAMAGQESNFSEMMTRQHFQMFADTVKQIENPIKRADTAKLLADVFAKSNPRFDITRFMAAAGVESEKNENEGQIDDEYKFRDWLKKNYNMEVHQLTAQEYSIISKRYNDMLAKQGIKSEDKEPTQPHNKLDQVSEFVKSFYDYTSNQFPKGETAVITAVQKRFGEQATKIAQETIRTLQSGEDRDIERIKKMAGISAKN